VNYANHLDTVGGFSFSADYPFMLGKVIEAAKPGALTVFTIGTAGNVNHVDVSTARVQKGHEEAARIGAILGGEVLRTLSRKMADTDGSLAVSREVVPLVLGEPGDLGKAREVLAAFGKPNPAAFLDQVRAFRALDIDGRKGKPIDAEVQVIALGRDVAWVGLPGEVFVELGKAIKVASPFRLTIVAELANDSPGYIPDRQAYPQGAYEVISSRVAVGSGEKLVESAVRQLVELHRVNTRPR
jgi:neutral ceramidase